MPIVIEDKFLTVDTSEDAISQFLQDAVLTPRLALLKWSMVTKQTQNMRVGYPFQHLSSLLTGVEGERTGARGNDLRDGSEVKSCSRADQVDKCKKCKNNVARMEKLCENCGSDQIKRNNDSKWLFAIKTQAELDLLVDQIDRVLLMIADYPNFDAGDYGTVEIKAYEIWPKESRHAQFKKIMTNYYNNIYLAHRQKNPKKGNIAPKNFWPYSYQFFLCNPIKTFCATIEDYNGEPSLTIDDWVKPSADRALISPEPMPVDLLVNDEVSMVSQSEVQQGWVSGETRLGLPLREDRIAEARTAYKRL